MVLAPEAPTTTVTTTEAAAAAAHTTVAAYLAAVGETTYAAVLTALILPQMYLQATTFLVDPIKNDVKYQAAAQPFLVLGILVVLFLVLLAGGKG